MRIGTVKEIKTHEYRVGLTPACVKAYVSRGHEVWIETGAGDNTGFSNEEYIAQGGIIIDHREQIFGACDMIVKVKEPLAEECELLREGQILFTYLHLAASMELTQTLLSKRVKAVAYETIETEDGSLPCLKPMSEIAGRLSVQEGAKYLEKTFGGRGVLLGGVPGIPRGNVAILGGGVVGTNACKVATGMGADVTVLDVNHNRLTYLDDIFSTRITTLYSNDANIEQAIQKADIIIGGVLITGAKAPHLIKREHLALMKKGAVLVDVAVDQGGCFETTHPTTHDDPIYLIDDIVHYAVTNMPGVVALSSTQALTSATLKYGLQLAGLGLERACGTYPDLRRGLNLYEGHCVHENLAQSLDIPYTSVEILIQIM
jgi:alanine dehydrogenase